MGVTMDMEKNFNFSSVDAVDEEQVVAYKGIYNRFVKRLIDIVLAVFLFILMLP